MTLFPDHRSLLVELGQRIGIADLAFDDGGYCCLKIGESVLNIEFDEAQGHFLIYCAIGQLPREPTLERFRQLAELNYASLLLGKGGVGADERSGRIMFVERLPLRGLDAGLLETELRATVERIEAMTKLVMADRPAPSAEPAEPEYWDSRLRV
jgi:Tir chaperone family protein CesT